MSRVREPKGRVAVWTVFSPATPPWARRRSDEGRQRLKATRRQAGQTLHAEWTKLRTVPGPGWLLLAAKAAVVGAATLATGAVAVLAGGLLLCLRDT